MRVLVIWGSDYPWDIRIDKFLRTLVDKGHQAHLLCRNLEGLQRKENVESVTIHRLTLCASPRLRYVLSFPVFLNPTWLWATIKIICQDKIDVIIVRDLPLALCAVVAGRLCGRPVIMDMAENYVALLEDTWKYEPFRIQNVFLRNPKLAGWVEMLATRLLDHIVVVVEEAKERLIKDGVPRGKIDVVSNTPDIDFFKKAPLKLADEDMSLMENRYVIIYVGGLEFSRGLDQVVRSMVEVVNKIPESLFMMIGDGNSKEHLRNLSMRLGIERNVTLRGWVDFEHIPAFLDCASVGIIPHYVTNHTNYTIPNKIFDYMYHGLPVVASECRPMARILNDIGCGVTFSDTEHLSKILINLRDPDISGQLSANGRDAVINRYNWAYDSERLDSTIRSVMR
jgi:glycosyltransferase involved in cell wall biosynthesis